MGRARERPRARPHQNDLASGFIAYGTGIPFKSEESKERLRWAREYPFSLTVLRRTRALDVPKYHPLRCGIPDAAYECAHENLPMTPAKVREQEGCSCWDQWAPATGDRTLVPGLG